MSEIGVRETIIREMIRRLWSIKEDAGYPFSVSVVRRNPESPSHTYPAIHVFEMEDEVTNHDSSGKMAHKRLFNVLLEFWVKVARNQDSSVAVRALYDAIRWSLLFDGGSFSGLCQIAEVQASRIVKPKFGDVLIAGQGVTFGIVYVDKIFRP